jgi:hypothetical protein
MLSFLDRVDVIEVCYPSISDKNNFDKVLATLKWPEEREEIKTKLGL